MLKELLTVETFPCDQQFNFMRHETFNDFMTEGSPECSHKMHSV